MPKIGFVGGGQMATALASGAIEAGVFTAADMVFAQPSSQGKDRLRKRFPEAAIVDSGVELLPKVTHVVLSVKPHVLRQIASSLQVAITPNHLLVSVAGGISLSDLQQMLGTQRVIRVMPNTPCQVGEGASAMSSDELTRPEDIAWVENLMKSVGVLEQIPDSMMHAFTGIAGSSPAYLYLVIEGLSDGGVAQGMPRALATRMAAQAVLGAAKMVLETGLHPGQLKDQVTSPGGTTIAALRTLEQAGVRSAFMEAVADCTKRSQEMA